MTNIRFLTPRDLFDTFPAALVEMGVEEPSDEPSLDYLEALAAEATADKAVTFCAYLLPRREAVWWGCRSVRLLQPHRPQDAGYRVAEDWVRDPGEPRRGAALQFGTQGDTRSPTTWLALAAGWSNGGQAPNVPPLPLSQTASCVRTAVLKAACYAEPARRLPGLVQCVRNGMDLIRGEGLDGR